jgi:hypothetical protein
VSVHHCWWGPYAQWITWAGVTVAIAGALIATPDATLVPAWHWAKDACIRIGSQLARRLPFLCRTRSAEQGKAADAGAATEHVSVGRRFEWNDLPANEDKIEFLHEQVELLWRHVRQEIPRVEATLSSAVELAKARQQEGDEQLARLLEARERRAARVDAHGLAPITAGIVLTSIPGELADVAVIGWASIIAGFAVTLWAGLAVRTDQGT